MSDLVTPEEGMSPVTDHSNDSGYETCNYAPADDNANQDSFQDKDRQKTLAQGLVKELHKAPWKKQLATGPLDDLKKMTKTVKPIYEGFWYNSDQDILARLDQASKKLKERRSAQPQDNQEDDNAMPATPNLEKSCSLSNEPIGHEGCQWPNPGTQSAYRMTGSSCSKTNAHVCCYVNKWRINGWKLHFTIMLSTNTQQYDDISVGF